MPIPGQTPAADAVDLRYKSLTVARVPQPRQLPPPAFDKSDLQKVFADIIPVYALIDPSSSSTTIEASNSTTAPKTPWRSAPRCSRSRPRWTARTCF